MELESKDCSEWTVLSPLEGDAKANMEARATPLLRTLFEQKQKQHKQIPPVAPLYSDGWSCHHYVFVPVYRSRWIQLRLHLQIAPGDPHRVKKAPSNPKPPSPTLGLKRKHLKILRNRQRNRGHSSR